MELLVNSLIEYLDDLDHPLIVRVLYINSSGGRVVVIDVDSHCADPVWHDRAEIEQSLTSGVARILEQDHARPAAVFEEEISKKDREFRDKAWQSIASLFSGENSELMLYQCDRARLVEQQVAQADVSRKTLYKRVRRYWQGGQTINTQLPRYWRSGAKGKGRDAGEQKLGRPSLRSKAENRAIGVNVNGKLKQIIISGGIQFYENRGEPSYEWAYLQTLMRFCNKGYQLVNGVRVPIMPSADEVFTLRQFKYHYQNPL